MKRNLWQRLKFAWQVSRIIPTRWSMVGNRTIEVGMVGTLEVTTIVRETSQPDGYSREELLSMLRLIRTHEEFQHWKVPEPHRCVYCSHTAEADRNGFCPACDPPQCSLHEAGLAEGYRKAIELNGD